MITATRRIQFCAGHRVAGHESKCLNLHGHNYVAFLTAAPDIGLDRLGRVVDFSVLKERVGRWILENWDHGFIVWAEDETALEALQHFEALEGQKMFVSDWNPTAENMARHLLERVGPSALHGTGVSLVEVTLWETENCYACASV